MDLLKKIQVLIQGKEDVSNATKKASAGLRGLKKESKDVKDALKDVGQTKLEELTQTGNAATNSLGRLATACGPVGIAIAGVVASLTAAVGLSKKAYGIADDWAAVVNDIEDKTNMCGESASKLAGVAKMVGLSGAEMGQALALMSKNAQTASEAINDAALKGEASTDVFTKWGIQIKDANGQLLSSEQIYKNVNAAHRKMANGVEKTAMEMEIFGRSGAKMNDLLNLSESQVDATTKKLEEMGLVISHETSQAFEDVDQKGRLLGECIDGLYMQMGAQFIPVVDRCYDELIDLVTSLNDSGTAMKFAEGMTSLATSSIDVLTVTVEGCKAAWTELIQPIIDCTKAVNDFIESCTGLDVIGVITAPGILGRLAQLGKNNRIEADYKKMQQRIADGWTSSGNSDDWDIDTTKVGRKEYQQKNLEASRLNRQAATANKEAAKLNQEAIKEAERIAANQNTIIGNADALAKAGKVFGNNGCTAFVDAALANTKFREMFKGAGRRVDYVAKTARAQGFFHEGMAGVGKGDTIFYDNGDWSGYGQGSHVGIYDGNGGVYHNSSSAGNRAYHASDYTQMGPNTKAFGYIATGQGQLDSGVSNAYNLVMQDTDKTLRGMGRVTEGWLNEIARARNSDYENAVDELNKHTAEYMALVDKAKEQGLDTSALDKSWKVFSEFQEKRNNLLKETDSHEAIMNEYQWELDTHQKYQKDLLDAQLQQLEKYKGVLKQQLEATEISEKEKQDIRRQYLEAQAQEEELAAQKTSTVWSLVGDTLKNKTFNYAEVITQTTDNINDSILSSMQNWIGSQESLGDRLVNMWQNVANSVINMIMEIVLQQTVLGPLQNALGGMFNKWGKGAGAFASGGYSPGGFALVGENGPELVRFNQPARIHNASETRDLLGGSSSNQTIVMNVTTPNAQSFQQSRSQIAANMAAMVRRGQMVNG